MPSFRPLCLFYHHNSYSTNKTSSTQTDSKHLTVDALNYNEAACIPAHRIAAGRSASQRRWNLYYEVSCAAGEPQDL